MRRHIIGAVAGAAVALLLVGAGTAIAEEGTSTVSPGDTSWVSVPAPSVTEPLAKVPGDTSW